MGPPRLAQRGRLYLGHWVAMCLMGTFLTSLIWFGRAEARPAKLQEVEAAYIIKFAHYVSWPDSAFRGASSPLVIVVLNDSPLAHALERAVSQMPLQRRPLHVRHIESTENLSGVHMLILPPSHYNDFPRVLGGLAGRPILTVASPAPSTLRGTSGAMVQLVMENDRLRFDVSLAVVPPSLQISALMLSAARRVDRSSE